jgi:hypothetical protein
MIAESYAEEKSASRRVGGDLLPGEKGRHGKAQRIRDDAKHLARPR